MNRLRLNLAQRPAALAAGSTSADLARLVARRKPRRTPPRSGPRGLLRYLLVVDVLNPLTATGGPRNPAKRQLLRRSAATDAAESIEDRIVGTGWFACAGGPNQLRSDYSFTTFCATCRRSVTPVEDVSMFFGQPVPVHEGRPMAVDFHDASAALPADTDA